MATCRLGILAESPGKTTRKGCHASISKASSPHAQGLDRLLRLLDVKHATRMTCTRYVWYFSHSMVVAISHTCLYMCGARGAMGIYPALARYRTMMKQHLVCPSVGKSCCMHISRNRHARLIFCGIYSAFSHVIIHTQHAGGTPQHTRTRLQVECL